MDISKGNTSVGCRIGKARIDMGKLRYPLNLLPAAPSEVEGPELFPGRAELFPAENGITLFPQFRGAA
eukprot:6618345-Prorocentrum_lima.AAC.1